MLLVCITIASKIWYYLFDEALPSAAASCSNITHSSALVRSEVVVPISYSMIQLVVCLYVLSHLRFPTPWLLSSGQLWWDDGLANGKYTGFALPIPLSIPRRVSLLMFFAVRCRSCMSLRPHGISFVINLWGFINNQKSITCSAHISWCTVVS